MLEINIGDHRHAEDRRTPLPRWRSTDVSGFWQNPFSLIPIPSLPPAPALALALALIWALSLGKIGGFVDIPLAPRFVLLGFIGDKIIWCMECGLFDDEGERKGILPSACEDPIQLDNLKEK